MIYFKDHYVENAKKNTVKMYNRFGQKCGILHAFLCFKN